MKKFLITIIFLLSCIGVFSQTAIPPASTWTPARNIINANFSDTYDSIAANRLRVNILNDSILAYATAINLRLLKSDTTSMLANYTRNGELNSALAAKVNVSDTAAMLSHYALTSELGDAGIAIGDVRDEIADSLNVLRPLYVAAADTAAMLNPYAKLTDLSDGGIGIGAVQEEIADSLNVLRPLVIMLADTTGTAPGSYVSGYTFQTGMSNKLMTADSLTAYVTPSQLSDSLATVEGGGVTLETVQGEISDSLDARIGAGIELSDVAVMIADSTGNTAGNYVTRQALIDSINANLGGAVGITLNSGTITLNGSEGTADDITFYTNGDGSYDLPSGGGNLTIMSQVQGWISDSLTKVVLVTDTTTMLSNYLLDSETAAAVTGFDPAGGSLTLSGADAITLTSFASTSIRIPTSTNDTIATQAYARSYGGSGTVTIGDVRDEIADSLNVLRPLKADVNKVRMLADTIPLFVFGAGGGNAVDTVSFTTNTLYGAFYNGGSDTLKITELRAVMVAGSTPLGTDTLAIQVYWNDSINVTTGASVTLLNSSPLGINSVTTGTSDTSFANSKIPPNVWVFMKSPGVVTGRKPNMLVTTLMGYKIPKY